MNPTILLLVTAALILYTCIAHYISYSLEKNRILRSKKWGLNICCGKTDGGGVNADVMRHRDLPNFVLVDNIYKLPFEKQQFDFVLCSHTLEHVDDPERFFRELSRVGRQVTVVVPPLYDISALLNIFEHRYIFLTFKKEHHCLPPFVKLPFAEAFQRSAGQGNHA